MARMAVIGITTDVSEATAGRPKADVSLLYAQRVAEAGGVPILLAPIPDLAQRHLEVCHGIVLTGGDDPRMEEFGAATDPRATLVHPQRQAYERALLRALDQRGMERPALGVCLGMQMMALHAGGGLDQHMPDRVPTHARHKNGAHEVSIAAGAWAQRLAGRGTVWSNHRQAVTATGRLETIGRSDDGVIEAIADPARAFYLGVQWHPERTDDAALGPGVFAALVAAARAT